MTRPQHSTEPAFQLMMAFVHAFCGVTSVVACVYHLRRIQREGTEAPSQAGTSQEPRT